MYGNKMMYFHPDDDLEFETLSHCLICSHSLDSAIRINTRKLYLHDLPHAIEIVSCTNCRMVLQRHRLAQSEWKNFNNAYTVSSNAKWDKLNHRFNTELDILNQVCKPGAAILDVGCGFVELVKHLAEAGFTAEGIDPRGDALVEGRNRFGLTLHDGFYDHNTQKMLGTLFDAIVSVHVFEHFPLPKETLLNMAKSLKPGGFCLLTVPDVAPVEKDNGIKPYDFYTPGHLFYYDQHTLANLLKKTGFKVVFIDRNFDPISEKPILRALAKKQLNHKPDCSMKYPGYSIDDMQEYQSDFIEKRERVILDNLSLPPSSRVVVYGTWLYGILTLNALEKNGHTVIAVVDSDEGKWHHMFSGHVIQPPEIIKNSNPDAVVVTSISGYQAIKKIIRSEICLSTIPVLSISGGIIH